MSQINNSVLTTVIFLLLYSTGFNAQQCSNETTKECYICNTDRCYSGFYEIVDSSLSPGCDPQPAQPIENSTETPTIIAKNGSNETTEAGSTENSTVASSTGNVTNDANVTTVAPSTPTTINYIVCGPCHDLCKTCNGGALENCTECKYTEVNGVCSSRPEENPDDDGIGTGVIVGAVVGGCVLVGLIIVVIVLIMRYRRRQKSSTDMAPKSLEQLSSVEEAPTSPTGSEGFYENIPNKKKDFGEMVQRKQDDITRYKKDPTVKETTQGVDPFYQNKAIAAMHMQQAGKDKYTRSDSNELNEIKALPEPPPPPGINEPSEDYANFNVQSGEVTLGPGNATTETDGMDDYQNVPSNLHKRPTVVVEPSSPDVLICEPNEEYQNTSQIRASGNANAGFVDTELEPYGNQEVVQEWRRSGENRTNAVDDHIYGNVPLPRT